MKNMKKFASLGLSLVMMLSLAACGGSKTPAASGSAAPAGSADGSAAAAESDLEYVKGKGKLVVGITDFAPMDYKDKDGKWIGFDADNATAFAKSLGVDVEFIEVDWDNKIMELDSKSIDCVWSRTPWRLLSPTVKTHRSWLSRPLMRTSTRTPTA